MIPTVWMAFIAIHDIVGRIFWNDTESKRESTSDGKKSANKERAATVIQSAWRRYKKREIQKLENAAAIIQTAWRIYQHKKTLEATEMEINMKRKRHKKRKRDPPSKLPNAAENFWIDSLENLEFVGQLGQGGFGNVLLYNNRQTGQDFAIKIQDAANKAMFDNETLLLRNAQGSSFVTKLCGVFATKETTIDE
ncbi:uncharacterized protein LOC122962117 [Acropora millepora]|uniref:uncharacterized protein LOC122962117 n=1 Tax=Acropora millepora TaxID=45264 RepID=UPI001CF44DD7|nr:uncharacterized protein LOC122962117 [Acropora millepora]